MKKLIFLGMMLVFLTGCTPKSQNNTESNTEKKASQTPAGNNTIRSVDENQENSAKVFRSGGAQQGHKNRLNKSTQAQNQKTVSGAGRDVIRQNTNEVWASLLEENHTNTERLKKIQETVRKICKEKHNKGVDCTQ